MNPTQALAVKEDIERVLRKHGLWYKVEEDKRPQLKMITFSNISIRIDEPEEKYGRKAS